MVAVGVPLDDGERVAVMAFLPDRARNLQLCFARLRDAVQTSREDISCAQAAEFWVLRPEQTHAERKTVKNPFGPGGLGPG